MLDSLVQSYFSLPTPLAYSQLELEGQEFRNQDFNSESVAKESFYGLFIKCSLKGIIVVINNPPWFTSRGTLGPLGIWVCFTVGISSLTQLSKEYTWNSSVCY